MASNSWTWEQDVERVCAVCGRKITLTMASWSSGDKAFLLCGEHFSEYGRIWRER